MNIKLKKESLVKIDSAFVVLKANPRNCEGLKIIEDSLKECFDLNFTVRVITVPNEQVTPLFVMSVYPETSTINRILKEVMEGSSKSSAIQKLWEENKNWHIEIDERLLTASSLRCTERELTAILMHEIGHIVCTNSIPARISTIFRYEIMTSKMSNKILANEVLFQKILSMPILNACISDAKRDKDMLKEEIKADTFAKKMGYRTELISVLTKVSRHPLYPKSGSINENLKATTDMSLDIMDQIKERQGNLARRSLFSLRESCTSPYMKDTISAYYETLFGEAMDSLTLSNGRKTDVLIESANNIVDRAYMTEFFIFGGKKLKPISPSEIDYIEIKINTIKNEDDKMMLIIYLQHKLDMVEYYISILQNEKLRKKYDIPHTMEEMETVKKRLLMLKERILAYPIPKESKNYIVVYPAGFEG